jgi:O-antigen/teichoic acid export membrane protein
MNATLVVSESEAPLRPLTGGAVMSAASQIWVTITGGTVTIVLARVLGPRDWGAYSIAVSLVAILVALTSLGVNQGITYFVASRKWAPRAAFAASLRVAALAGAFGAGAGLAARAVYPSAFAGLPLWLTAVAVVALPFLLALLYAAAVALAIDRYEASMSMPAVQSSLGLAIVIPAAVIFGRTGAVAALTVSAIVAAIGAIGWALRRLPRGTESEERSQLRQAVGFGIKSYGGNALQLVNYQLDLFILAAVAPAAAVGRYALAVSATTMLLLLPRALSNVLYPRVAQLSAGGEMEDREMVETKSLRHVSLIVGVTTLGMAVALELLVVPVFGADYRRAIDLGLILLPGLAVMGLSQVLAATIVGRGKPIYPLYVTFVTTPLTIAMYLTMIPWLHATGAALASTLSYLATFVLLSGFYRHVTGRQVWPLLVPTRSEFADLRALGRAVRSWVSSRA